MKILLTGANGMLGSAIAEQLAKTSHSLLATGKGVFEKYFWNKSWSDLSEYPVNVFKSAIVILLESLELIYCVASSTALWVFTWVI